MACVAHIISRGWGVILIQQYLKLSEGQITHHDNKLFLTLFQKWISELEIATAGPIL